MAFTKQYLIQNTTFAKLFKPLKKIAKYYFGDTSDIIRSGNWYGNNTIYRMILDLNKILFFANIDGTLRKNDINSKKKYIGIVDAIFAGEGFGPLAPDKVKMGYLMCGHNPVAIDSVAAQLMGFDPMKIPAIANAFNIKKYSFCDFKYVDIQIKFNEREFLLQNIPKDLIVQFEPFFGWKNHIEI